MLKLNHFNPGTSTALAFLISVTTSAPFLTLSPAAAQRFSASVSQLVVISNPIVIPAGTQIPVLYDKAEKILVTAEETMPLTLKVAAEIKDSNGTILIPAGSQIIGQIEPAEGSGSRFVAQELKINQNTSYPLDATSQVVVRTETINQGASAGDILKGTLAGAGAATLIAGLTGDRRIDALEVLAGAAVGTLAGWALPETGTLGGSTETFISIDPDRDLTLTLESDLIVYAKLVRQYVRPLAHL
jgi:hypothetical protein